MNEPLWQRAGLCVATLLLSLSACTRPSAPVAGDAGATSAIWIGDAAPSAEYPALVSFGECGDLVLFDRANEVHRWDGGTCDPCLMGCASYAGPLAAQESLGSKMHPYIAAMLGCAARCSDSGVAGGRGR